VALPLSLGAPLSSEPGTLADRLLTTREVAAFLGVSPETVLRRWRAGELPGYRLASNVLRFRESELDAWLEGTRPERSVVSVAPRSYDRRHA
jgi:excisionase family DNA binding protein